MDGQELRRRRLALGWTQAELAQRLEVAPNTVARWERGERGIAHPAMLSAMLDVIEAKAANAPSGSAAERA
jgi:transcriptional regulator with XRE-family HTH domain